MLNYTTNNFDVSYRLMTIGRIRTPYMHLEMGPVAIIIVIIVIIIIQLMQVCTAIL